MVRLCLDSKSSLNANDPFEDTETLAEGWTWRQAVLGLNANDPFEDTETSFLNNGGRGHREVSMPTIRSRILKQFSAGLRIVRERGLNANDPFEDTET